MFHCITRGGSKGKAGGSAPPPPYFGSKDKKIAADKPARQATNNRVPPLAQGLDPLLITTMVNLFSTKF